MRITGWTWPENPEYEDICDYPITDEQWEEYTNIVVDEIRKNGYKISGYEHQDLYAPVFDDKYYCYVSLKTWGEVMRKAYPEETENYMKWAWQHPKEEEKVFPDTIK